MALWSNTDTNASKPKYLNTADKAATLGVSVAEAQTAGNIAKGINTPGWVKYTTYTDAQGNTRNKSEVLVAMASITGDNDTIDPDPVGSITTQPANVTAAGGVDAVFTVVATSTPVATLSYQWQVSTDGVSYVNVSGATAATLTVASTSPNYVDGNYFRVAVTPVGGAAVISNAATLTVTA
jgi:hypothetical protein